MLLREGERVKGERKKEGKKERKLLLSPLFPLLRRVWLSFFPPSFLSLLRDACGRKGGRERRETGCMFVCVKGGGVGRGRERGKGGGDGDGGVYSVRSAAAAAAVCVCAVHILLLLH